MNRLITYLQKSGTIAIPQLRATYRALVMRTHPDLSKSGGRAFIRLQAEYEEAIQYLLGSRRPVAYRQRPLTAANCRRLLLSHMYLYSLRFPSGRAASILSRAIEISGMYDAHVRNMLIAYKKRFLEQYSDWKADPVLVRLHDSLLTAIKQLACHFQTRNDNGRRLVISVLDNLLSQTAYLDHLKGATLRDFCAWLRREVDGEVVFMFDTWEPCQNEKAL